MDKNAPRESTRPAPAAPAELPDDPAALKALLLSHQRRIAELELDNLLLNHRLAVALKQCYGPRADKVSVGQLLLDFAVKLEARPIVTEVTAWLKSNGLNPSNAVNRIRIGLHP